MAARTWTVFDQATGQSWSDGWHVDGGDVGASKALQVRTKRYHSGLSDGVWGIEVDNGAWQFEILPTRGMSLWRAQCGDLPLGWRSPVRGPVHPHFVPLSEPSGLGWLDGFDELLVRCGLESNGAPEFDPQGRLKYPLHGRIGNRPAYRLDVTLDGDTRTIAVTGHVEETRFHFLSVRLSSTLRTSLGQPTLSIEDRVTNLSASPAEIQMLYHVNFGSPLLDAGSRVFIPARQVVPRNARAASGVGSWDHFAAEQAGFEEQVYFLDMFADERGQTEALLKNAHGTRGVSLRYAVAQLPCFSLWKNTTAVEDGYVTGLEPGTNYPNPRTFEGQHGRVVKLAGGASCEFRVDLDCHMDARQIEAAEGRIAKLARQAPQTHPQPLPDWCAP